MTLKPIPLTADPNDPESPKGAIPVEVYGVSGDLPELAEVATSGLYDDLKEKPTIPEKMPNSIKVDSGSIVDGATGVGSDYVAVGIRAKANDKGVAVGKDANAENNGVSIGNNAEGEDVAAVAVGSNSAAALQGIAIGTGAKAESQSAISVGTSSVCSGTSGTAIGYLAEALHSGSVALGYQTKTKRNHSVAVGSRNIEIDGSTNGLILESPDESKWRIRINDDGELSARKV